MNPHRHLGGRFHIKLKEGLRLAPSFVWIGIAFNKVDWMKLEVTKTYSFPIINIAFFKEKKAIRTAQRPLVDLIITGTSVYMYVL